MWEYHQHDLALVIVEFGVGLFLRGVDRFTRRLPLLTQLTDVLLDQDCTGGQGSTGRQMS